MVKEADVSTGPMAAIERRTQAWAAQLGVSEALTRELSVAYLPVAQELIRRRQLKTAGPLMIGINGAQGSGKSTMFALLLRMFEQVFEVRCAGLSIDDLYLTRAERSALAETVHPLLATRGVPGTHDVALAHRVLDALSAAGPGHVTVPSFDKAADDRHPEVDWPHFEIPCELVILEGWCVGARPELETELLSPCNALEAEHDGDGRYRRYVNDRLSDEYQALFARLDVLIMLRVPSFECVRRFRTEQEHGLLRRLRNANPHATVMSDEEVAHFVAYFERLTRWMLREMPARADVLVTVEEDHSLAGVEIRPKRT